LTEIIKKNGPTDCAKIARKQPNVQRKIASKWPTTKQTEKNRKKQKKGGTQSPPTKAIIKLSNKTD